MDKLKVLANVRKTFLSTRIEKKHALGMQQLKFNL